MRPLFALLLLTGCVRPATRVAIVVPAPEIQDIEGCDADNTNYYWLGADGVIGIGSTCKQAILDWRSRSNPTVEEQI